MQQNCGKDTEKIEFWCSDMSESLASALKTVVPNVETVKFRHDGFDSENSRVDLFLNDLPLLKNLSIYYNPSEGMNWHLIKCPQLDSFEITVCKDSPIDGLNKFFEENPTITRFKCDLHDPSTDNVQLIFTIASQCKNIKEFHLNIDSEIDFAMVQSQLKMLDERESFERFGLILRADLVENLPSLKSVTELHLRNPNYYKDNQRCLEHHLPALNTMSHLKVLLIEEYVGDDCAGSLAQNLQGLEKLSVDLRTADGIEKFIEKEPTVKSFIKPFVLFAPKLVEFEVQTNFDIEEDDTFNRRMLTEGRKNLKDAAKLNIFMESEHPRGPRSRDLVEIKRTRKSF